MKRRFWKVWASVVGVAVLVPAAIFARIHASTWGVDGTSDAAKMEWFLANVDSFRLLGHVGFVSVVVVVFCGVVAVAHVVGPTGPR